MSTQTQHNGLPARSRPRFHPERSSSFAGRRRPGNSIGRLAATIASLLLITGGAIGQMAGNGGSGGGDDEDSGGGSAMSSRESVTAFHVEQLNPMLPELDDPPNRMTPQAAVESFLFASREGDWEKAARTLNFELLPEITPEEAALLAEMFFFVVNQELWIDWTQLPDRPDGLIEGTLAGNGNPLAGTPRRSISMGSIELQGRPIPIRLERVKPKNTEAMWVFSAQTVDNINALYAQHGPGYLARHLPEWAKQRGWFRIPVWQWIALALLIGLAPLAGAFVARVVLPRVAGRLPRKAGTFVRMLELPIGVVITLLIWSLVLELALSFPAPLGTLMSTAATVGLIAAIGWLIGRCIHFGIEYVAKDALRDRTEEASSDQRRLLTQLTVARHVTVIVIAFVVIAVVLIEFNVFRTLGVVLLTSAGAAAVIIGIAGHAVLGNLIAGLQIALTRPFRVGDSVYIENNWGRIEDITYTYVVVNTWDKRRLVLPIRYFVSNWFENWEINQRFLMKPIYLRVDFRADVDRIRKKFFELIRADDRLDEEQEPPSVLVTNCDDETIVVRLTAGSSTATEAWYMSCETRENLLAWLREAEDGAWLPRRRLAFEDRPAAASS